MPKQPKKARWFVVTQWNTGVDYKKLLQENTKIRYLAYGEEHCPSTDRKHHQLFMYLRNNVTTGRGSLGKMGKWFGEEHCHVEPMYGSIEENESYCSKEGKLREFGDKPKQGCRGDLDETKEGIMKGDITVDELAVENPSMYHQYGRTLTTLEDIALRQRWRTEMTTAIWYTGPSGVGKSHACFKNYSPETHYVKPLGTADLKWWDGYRGQETVIFNEFRGQIPFSELCDIIDKWPLSVSRRGREPVPFMAKRVLISSIKRPEDVYVNQVGEPWEQFTRRVQVIELRKSAQR